MVMVNSNGQPLKEYLIIITGLDKTPNFLADTMLPNISPEVAAEASVLSNGGLDPCEYAVSARRVCYL